MLGVLERNDSGRGPVRVEPRRLLELTVLQASLPGGRRWERQLDRAARLLRRQGVRRVLPPLGFADWEPLTRRGLGSVEAAPLYRAMAAPLALAALERRGTDPLRAAVALRGEGLDPDLVRAARLLCPRVRDLVIDVPRGGSRLAGELYRDYGLPVLPGSGRGADVVLCFDGPAGERELGLSAADVQLRGLTLEARGRELPGELEPAPLLSALWQAGRLGLNELQVTF